MSHFRRRQFLMVSGTHLVALLGLNLFAAPVPCIAQTQTRIPRIGVLIPGARHSDFHQAFLRGMRDLGYVDGKNIVVEVRHADGKMDRLPALAEDLVRLRIDIIVAASTPAVHAARRATDVIPIVMAAVGDPVGSDLVTSLSRPGGNITGHAILSQDTAPKLLELVREVVRNASRITVLVNSDSFYTLTLNNIQNAAEKIKVRVSVAAVRAAADLEGVFAAAARERQSAIVVPADPLFNVYAREIANLALRHKLPTAFSESRNVDAGGLMSYGASVADSFRRAAAYVDKIIKGAKPGEIPVEQVTTFEAVINLRTAKTLGLTIPGSVLLRADRVIE